MQTPVRTATPRIVNISRRGSTTSTVSVQVEHEISVVRRTCDATESSINPVYRTTSTVSNGIKRVQSDRNLARLANSSPAQWKSKSTMTLPQERTEYDTRSLGQLDSNRESMRALADFLNTREPPPDHFMSMPDWDVDTAKRSSFGLFKKKGRKQRKTPKMIKLPDSAISARTLHGSRHIAISIPLEYDYLYSEKPQKTNPFVNNSVYTPAKNRYPAPVVVLKPEIHQPTKLSPLAEVHEASSPKFPASFDTGKRDSSNSRIDYPVKLEDIPVLQNESQRQKSYIAVSPDDTLKRDSQFGDLRHSGGTIYSTATINDRLGGHSREISSVSTAPSAMAVRVELPPRGSSNLQTPLVVQSDLARAYDDEVKQKAIDLAQAFDANLRRNEQARSTHIVDGELFSPSNFSLSPGADEGPVSGMERLRFVPSPPPSAGLSPIAPLPNPPDSPEKNPDIESPLDPDWMPSPSPRSLARPRQALPSRHNDTLSKRGSMMIANSDDSFAAAREARQERVRARKARDMAALREKSSPRDSVHLVPLSDISRETSQRSQRSQSLRHINPSTPRRRSMTIDQLYREASTLSEIMLVAELAPYTGMPSLSDFAFAPQRHPTPPRSAYESDAETVRQDVSRGRTGSSRAVVSQRSSPKSSPRSVDSGLDTRRQERRSKRNMTLRERELDMRIEKLERDNAMLIRTLSGIGKSFGELSKLLPGFGRPMETGSPRLEEMKEEEEPRNGGLEATRDQDEEDQKLGIPEAPEVPRGRTLMKFGSLEPVMRDLVGSAGRVSNESYEKRGENFDEFDANDGESILQ